MTTSSPSLAALRTRYDALERSAPGTVWYGKALALCRELLDCVRQRDALLAARTQALEGLLATMPNHALCPARGQAIVAAREALEMALVERGDG